MGVKYGLHEVQIFDNIFPWQISQFSTEHLMHLLSKESLGIKNPFWQIFSFLLLISTKIVTIIIINIIIIR